MKKILVIGKNGQVGGNLVELCRCQGLSRDEFDLSAPQQIYAQLKNSEADIIINAAAYTAVDQAENDRELCDNINHRAVAEIARFCAENDKLLVHYSTDYVFDGEGSAPFTEDDNSHLHPVNYYGVSKLAGENAVRESGCRHLILRTSWVYNHIGKNFVKTILRLAAEKEELRIVADQIGSPTYAADIAKVTLQMVAGADTGIYHIVPREQVSWCQFAEMILAGARELGRELAVKKIIPIATKEYPTPAKRPFNSRLSSAKLAEDYGIILPPLTQSLRTCLSRIYAS